MKKIFLLLFLLFPIQSLASVARSDSGAVGGTFSSVTSFDITTLTVSGSNRCLIGILNTNSNTISSPTAVWDNGGTNQSMTSIGSFGAGSVGRLDIFLLIAPTSGNKTAHFAWTTADGGLAAIFNFSGADQSTCYKSADTVTDFAGAPASLTVNSNSAGATVVAIADINTITSTDTQTEIFRASGESSASYGLGGSTNTHSWTTTGTHYMFGFHILDAPVGGVSAKTLLTLGVN